MWVYPSSSVSQGITNLWVSPSIVVVDVELVVLVVVRVPVVVVEVSLLTLYGSVSSVTLKLLVVVTSMGS